MPKYKTEITITNVYTGIEVEADDYDLALDKARDIFNKMTDTERRDHLHDSDFYSSAYEI